MCDDTMMFTSALPLGVSGDPRCFTGSMDQSLISGLPVRISYLTRLQTRALITSQQPLDVRKPALRGLKVVCSALTVVSIKYLARPDNAIRYHNNFTWCRRSEKSSGMRRRRTWWPSRRLSGARAAVVQVSFRDGQRFTASGELLPQSHHAARSGRHRRRRQRLRRCRRCVMLAVSSDVTSDRWHAHVRHVSAAAAERLHWRQMVARFRKKHRRTRRSAAAPSTIVRIHASGFTATYSLPNWPAIPFAEIQETVRQTCERGDCHCDVDNEYWSDGGRTVTCCQSLSKIRRYDGRWGFQIPSSKVRVNLLSETTDWTAQKILHVKVQQQTIRCNTCHRQNTQSSRAVKLQVATVTESTWRWTWRT